ncbi:class I SAM-dependent methyltransferase [Methylobrevis albus]|uniref:Class I SAM-dependent methyltransferase n=1 Tax=Methylobrevis albus TaxID=2793297 RepID=A0A931MZT3_9HYPH|nr:methyltransferase [Methylobrevis albus]MBH0238076.1 class I SAM-dependent methyltransferase [Methylobrevis albus]
MNDPALSSLFVPFEDGSLTLPEAGGTLFLRARAGNGFAREHAAQISCVQSFKPDADALLHEGFTVLPAPQAGGTWPLVLVLPPRQRDEARALFAEAIRAATPGGLVVAAVTNAEGARTAEADLGQLSPISGSVSKHKSRVFWTRIDPDGLDTARLDAAIERDQPREVVPGFRSRPGLFAFDHVDTGSALLAAALPADLSGRGADLGAGWGYLAAAVLAQAPGVAVLDLYEAEARALDLARANLADVAGTLGFHWLDVTRGLPSSGYDFIVMNPPFHERREDRADIGQAFIRAAAAALRPGGRLYMVANRHLPYEATLTEAFAAIKPLADASGYKVIEATAKPAAKLKPAAHKGGRDKGRGKGRDGKGRDESGDKDRGGRTGGKRR